MCGFGKELDDLLEDKQVKETWEAYKAEYGGILIGPEELQQKKEPWRVVIEAHTKARTTQ